MYIYKITNLVNGKIYIGQHSGKDLWAYLRHNIKHALDLNYKNKTILYNAFRKYVPIHGEDCFKIEQVVQLSPTLSKEEARPLLDKLEIFFIKHYNSRDDSIGYNITAGGGGQLGCSRPHTEEHKKRMAAIMAGRVVTWGDKISAGLTGRKLSEESRKKLSDSQRGVPKIPRTPEHCQKISDHKKAFWANLSKERKEEIVTAIKAGQLRAKNVAA